MDPRPTRTERTTLVVTLLVLCGLSFAGELVSEPAPSSAALVVDAIVLALVCAGAPWWSRRLVAGAGVVIALSAVVPAVTPAAATAVLLVARYRPLRVAVVVAGAGIGAQLARGLWRPFGEVGYGWWTVVVVAGYAAVAGWGAWMQAHRALLASRVEEAKRDERTRIAREMHDVLAHRLSLLSTVAGAIEYHPGAPAEELARSADVIRSTSHQALEDLREILGVLRSEDLTGADRPQPGFEDLSGLLEDWRAAGGAVEVDDEISDVAGRYVVPAGVGRTVYRVVQEALTNAGKHAPGQPVRIELGGEPGASLDVTVTNPLAGAGSGGAVPGSGVGIIGLAERVRLAGGRFDAGETPGGEYRVMASLPWPG